MPEFISLEDLKRHPKYKEFLLYRKKMKVIADKDITSSFQKLKLNRDFRKIVQQYKRELGLPDKGFKDLISANKFFDTKTAHGKSHQKRMYAYSLHILEKFNLNDSFRFPLQSYLKYGDLLPLTPTGSSNYHGEVRYEDDGVYIRVFPEANGRGLKELIDKNFDNIKAYLLSRFPIESQSKKSKQANSKRDILIYDMYKNGAISYKGKINIYKMEQYLASIGSDQTDFTKYMNKQKYKIPEMERRNQIIQKYIKLSEL